MNLVAATYSIFQPATVASLSGRISVKQWLVLKARPGYTSHIILPWQQQEKERRTAQTYCVARKVRRVNLLVINSKIKTWWCRLNIYLFVRDFFYCLCSLCNAVRSCCLFSVLYGSRSVFETRDVDTWRFITSLFYNISDTYKSSYWFNLLNPTGHVMHHQFNIQQLYALPTLYLCVLYLSENKQRLVPLTA